MQPAQCSTAIVKAANLIYTNNDNEKLYILTQTPADWIGLSRV